MDALRKIFYDELGGLSLAQLTRRSAKLGLSAAQVKTFYETQPVNQVTRGRRQLRRHFHQIVAPSIGFISADLLDYQNLVRQNRGYRYILTVIDIYSRYAWAFPLKHKSPEEILPHLKQVAAAIEARKATWSTFTINYGVEFLGAVKKWLAAQGIKTFIAQDRGNSTFKFRAAIIERFNRTISERITKAAEIKNSSAWIDTLPKVVESYNSACHSITGRSPSSIFLRGRKPKSLPRPASADMPKVLDYVYIAIDDSGAIRAKRGLRGKNNFSTEVYRILRREGYRYQVAPAGTLDVLPGLYLARQLLVVLPPSQQSQLQDLLQAEKTEQRRHKKIKTAAFQSGLDVNADGTIEPVPSKRLLGKAGESGHSVF